MGLRANGAATLTVRPQERLWNLLSSTSGNSSSSSAPFIPKPRSVMQWHAPISQRHGTCSSDAYRQWGTKAWHEVGEENLAEHLATLYANGPLILFGGDDDDVPSTISQPSFVLHTFRAFKAAKAGTGARTEYYFGLWDQAHQSLVVAKDDCLIAYGNAIAKDRLLQQVRQWVDFGMPSAACMALQVYPGGVPLMAGEREWIVKRPESQFLWSLKRVNDNRMH
jgi:hypothetical protein